MADTSDDQRWLLALDTSTAWAGIALTDGDTLAEVNWSAGRQQTTQVMPEVQRLLGTAGTRIGSVAAIAVATGPGSFSGLRVGMAIASGISVATGVPIIGVSTLLVTVHGWSGVVSSTVGVIKAGRSRYGWSIATDISHAVTGSITELIEDLRLREAGVVVGEVSEEDAVRIRELTSATVPQMPARLRRAGSLAQIGWERWKSGDYDRDAELEPIYLHRS